MAFEIGTNIGSMTDLSQLATPIQDPEYEYILGVDISQNADGSFNYEGLPQTEWHWGYLTAAQYTQLRTFCTGASANVIIKTPNDAETYKYYAAVMACPIRSPRRNSRVIDYTVTFSNMVEQAT